MNAQENPVASDEPATTTSAGTLLVVGELIFTFTSHEDWVNNAQSRFRPYKGMLYTCLNSRNEVCHIGEDFSYSRDNNLFPIRVYVLKRAAVNSLKPYIHCDSPNTNGG